MGDMACPRSDGTAHHETRVRAQWQCLPTRSVASLKADPAVLGLFRLALGAASGNTKAAKAGLLRERLKGLEPSTFCMASGLARVDTAMNALQMPANVAWHRRPLVSRV